MALERVGLQPPPLAKGKLMHMVNGTRVGLVFAGLFLVALPDLARAVSIEMVTVGDAGNAADDTTYGAVAEEYQLGKYEVTIQQYTDFLNAVASSDPYSLYNTTMGTDLNIAGISRSGSSGAYTYEIFIAPTGIKPAGASSPGNRPITYVSWFDAARFANWMHNGQGTGSTETGAYSLNGATSGTAPSVNPGARFFIPTEDQWYKAAYYKGGSTSAGYWEYATQSDVAPGNTIGSGVNQANYKDNDGYAVTQDPSIFTDQNYLTDVGAFSASQSGYGTFDQSGNVFEWNDLSGAAGTLRGLRDGPWNNNAALMSSASRYEINPTDEFDTVGFRLASPVAVPEPSTCFMGLAGITCAGWGAYRRHRAR